MVKVFIAPREEDLQHAMEMCEGRITVDQQPAPDERTDVAQDDAQLINGWAGLLLLHAQSVRCYPLDCKGSPRNLALSHVGASAHMLLAPLHGYTRVARALQPLRDQGVVEHGPVVCGACSQTSPKPSALPVSAGQRFSNQRRAIARRVSKGEGGGPVDAEAWRKLASVQAMGSAMARRDATPPVMRYKG